MRNRHLLTISFSSMKDYIFIMCWAHKRQPFALISIIMMRIWKFFTSNRVFKHKKVVSNLHVCCNVLDNMWPSFTFHFSTWFLTSTHKKGFTIFFEIYMTQCPTINFQLSKMSKRLAKHISTKVSFKITVRKRHFYITLVDLEYETSVSIWEFEDHRTNMIVLPSFKLARRLNSQNTNETEFTNEIWHINFFMNIGISNWHNWIFDLT